MPLSNLLKSAAGTCPSCHQKAGIPSREHPDCRRTFQVGWQEMVQLAADDAGSPDFDEGHLRLTLSAVAKISYGNEETVNQALEEGWKLSVDHSMADGNHPGRGSQAPEVQGPDAPDTAKRLTRRPVRGEVIGATAQSRTQATMQPESGG